jgi:hypothetical protein
LGPQAPPEDVLEQQAKQEEKTQQPEVAPQIAAAQSRQAAQKRQAAQRGRPAAHEKQEEATHRRSPLQEEKVSASA